MTTSKKEHNQELGIPSTNIMKDNNMNIFKYHDVELW